VYRLRQQGGDDSTSGLGGADIGFLPFPVDR
jgi:hypothetical protein